MRFSPLVDRISSTGTDAWSIHQEAARQRDLGHDVILLTVGDPDQATPAPVVAATIDALRRGRTGYAPIIGYPKVRQAIARRFARRTGLGAQEFAGALLAREQVAVLPCDGFGPSAVGYLRIALSAPDLRLEDAGRRIVRFAGQLRG